MQRKARSQFRVIYMNSVRGPQLGPRIEYWGFWSFPRKAYHCRKFQVSRTPESGQTIKGDKQTTNICLLLV